MSNMYLYLCFSQPASLRLVERKIQDHVKVKKLTITARYEEKYVKHTPFIERHLGRLFDHILKPGDALLVYEPANLGRSVSAVLDLLLLAMQKGIAIHFIQPEYIFLPKKCDELKGMLLFIKEMGHQFGSRLTQDDLMRKASAINRVGRPKGKQNRTLKLDEHSSDILNYLHLKVSKSSIARLLQCHPQTLQDWINRRKVLENQ